METSTWMSPMGGARSPSQISPALGLMSSSGMGPAVGLVASGDPPGHHGVGQA